jgi:hypothetical protein
MLYNELFFPVNCDCHSGHQAWDRLPAGPVVSLVLALLIAIVTVYIATHLRPTSAPLPPAIPLPTTCGRDFVSNWTQHRRLDDKIRLGL